jgi:hypothetical protein
MSRRYTQGLIAERVKRTHPFRSVLDEGIVVSGESDTPVTKMNPLGGIQACVNHPAKEQRIDVYEAIEMFTINGATIGFEEDQKGSVEAGKLADFVVLSDDPYRVPREKIGDIKVKMTIGGERSSTRDNQVRPVPFEQGYIFYDRFLSAASSSGHPLPKKWMPTSLSPRSGPPTFAERRTKLSLYPH